MLKKQLHTTDQYHMTFESYGDDQQMDFFRDETVDDRQIASKQPESILDSSENNQDTVETETSVFSVSTFTSVRELS